MKHELVEMEADKYSTQYNEEKEFKSNADLKEGIAGRLSAPYNEDPPYGIPVIPLRSESQ